jgi:hypothetical protein
MDSGSPSTKIYREITGELRDVARWFSGGGISPEQFRRSVEVFEAAKLERFGFRLSSEISKDGKVHFSLRAVESGELCACVEVNPATGEAGVHYAC